MTIKEKMEMVHRITERKESFAGVTKLNEFIYDKTNGKVPAGLDITYIIQRIKESFLCQVEHIAQTVG